MPKSKVSIKNKYTPGGDMGTWKAPKLGTPGVNMDSKTMKRMTQKKKAKKVKMS
jgi:hypothetical protein